ncbi:hypothetical protein WDV94_08085 [Clavibacter tessellarius]
MRTGAPTRQGPASADPTAQPSIAETATCGRSIRACRSCARTRPSAASSGTDAVARASRARIRSPRRRADARASSQEASRAEGAGPVIPVAASSVPADSTGSPSTSGDVPRRARGCRRRRGSRGPAEVGVRGRASSVGAEQVRSAPGPAVRVERSDGIAQVRDLRRDVGGEPTRVVGPAARTATARPRR